MRKYLILLPFMGMCLVTASAEDNREGLFNNPPESVQLHLDSAGPGEEEHTRPHRSPALLPKLFYEGNTFVLTVPFALENVTIVISDEGGTVLYQDSVPAITDCYTFYLGDDILCDAFSVEIYYGSSHLYGEL